MWDRLIGFLAEATGRERALLVLALVVALPLGVAFAVVLPQIEARAEARRALDEARAEAAWVAGQARLYGALATAKAAELDGPPLPISGIESSLVAAGLRGAVSELSDRGGGSVALRFDAVRFTALVAWLSQVHPGWGYALDAFTFERGEGPDTVSAALTLGPKE